jgi:hypothetical protein
METEIVILCIVTSVISSVLMAFFLRWVGERGVNHRITLCETQIDNLIQAVRGQTGNVVKAQKAERMNMAMGELALALKDPNADKGKVLTELAGKYPDLIMDFMKKQGLGL